MHNERGIERLKVLCLLLKHPFTIIFSVLPSGYGGTTEIIIFLPPQIKKADRKQEKFLFSLMPTTKLNIFYYWGSCCRSYPSFPRKDRGKESNWGSCHTVTLHKKAKENWLWCTVPACFLRDGGWEVQLWARLWKGALQNITTIRISFSKPVLLICILKGSDAARGNGGLLGCTD